MQDFNKRKHEFEREFDRARKFSIAFFVISGAVSLGLLGFGIWVVLLLLRHFGIL